MHFQEEIEALGRKSKNFGPKLLTEEATKNTLILPFIKLLGYDPFDPTEVVPECTMGDYKDSRVDYAIMKDGKSIIIIECKTYGDPLDTKKCNQLSHYFHGADAKVAILTDGNRYLFFSDLEAENIMDSKPYMELVLENVDSALIPEIKKLTRSDFNIDDAMTSASVMKYTREFKRIMAEQLNEPDDEILRFFLKDCYDGRILGSVLERFRPILKDALNLYIRDCVNARLEKALDRTGDAGASEVKADAPAETKEAAPAETPAEPTSDIVTTPDEWQGYYIIKSILLSENIDPNDVLIRDYKQFCAVSYKTIRQYIVRMFFNSKPYSIGIRKTQVVGDSKKDMNIFQLERVEDIYKYSKEIKEALQSVLNPSTDTAATSDSEA